MRVRQFCPWQPGGERRLLCPWDFPGKNTGVGCHFFLQRGSSWPGDWTEVSCSRKWILSHWATTKGCFWSPFPPGKQTLAPENCQPAPSLPQELCSLFSGTMVDQHPFLRGPLPTSPEIFFYNKVHLCVLQGAWGRWLLGLFLYNWPLALLKE